MTALKGVDDPHKADPSAHWTEKPLQTSDFKNGEKPQNGRTTYGCA